MREAIANQADDEVDADTRVSATLAVRRLEHHFGSDWPSTRAEGWHPMDELVGNRAPWTRHRLIELAEVMDRVAADPGWPVVRGRLRHPREAQNAILELDLARIALAAGLHLELQPAAAPGCFADLMVADSDGRLLVEITSIDDMSLAMHNDMAFQDRICDVVTIVSSQLAFGCEIFTRVPVQRRPEIEAQMHAFWRERIESRTPGRIDIDGVLAAWAAPVDDDASRDRYITEGPAEGFSGPVEDRTWLRIIRAVRSKVAQLPAGGQNLVVVRPPLTLVHAYPLATLQPALTEVLDMHPSLCAVAFTSRAWWGGNRHLRPAIPASGLRLLPESAVWVRAILLAVHQERATVATKRILDRWLP